MKSVLTLLGVGSLLAVNAVAQQGQQGQQGQQQNQQQNQDPRHQDQRRNNWDTRQTGQNTPGRSGPSKYQSNNNQQAAIGQDKPRLGPPPTLHTSPSDLQYLRKQHDFTYVYGSGARVGYFGYTRHWRDSYFVYPFYIFDPYLTFGFISPWYYYPNLPGYIDPDRCLVIGPNMLPRLFSGEEYGYSQQDLQDAYQAGFRQGSSQSQSQAGNRILNGALDDIVALFKNDDQRALDRLVPDSGNVNMYVDGQYSYSLAANDFYDMIRDNADTTHTTDYQILDVRTDGDQAKVMALHTFTDPWGQSLSVYHVYLLQVGNRSVQILDFGTSSVRPW